MAKRVSKQKASTQPLNEVVDADVPKKEKAEKVVSSKRISDPNKVVDRSSFALAEGVLLKDHGVDKKGDTISRHPNTLDMLREKNIVK